MVPLGYRIRESIKSNYIRFKIGGDIIPQILLFVFGIILRRGIHCYLKRK